MRRLTVRGFVLQRIPSNGGARVSFYQLDDMWIGGSCNDQTRLRDARNKLSKGVEVPLEVRVDVDVIVLDARDDGDFGSVVEKFSRLFKEGSVVFITFEHEGSSALRAGRDREAIGSVWQRPRAYSKVNRDTAN